MRNNDRQYRNILTVFFFMILSIASGVKAQTLAVLLAQNADKRVQAVYGQQITDSMLNVARKIKQFTVVERSQIENITNELKFQNSSALIDDKTAIGFGQQSGAQIVALSSFVPSTSSERLCDRRGCSDFFNLSLNVNTRFVEVKTGAVIFSKQIPASASGSTQADLLTAAIVDFERKFERELINAFPNVGYVIKMVSTSEFIVDLGRSSGIEVDDEFSVYVDGEDIVHPVTKKLIKGDKKIIAEGKISSLSDQSATLKLSGSPVSPIEVGVAKIQAKAKKKGFFESLQDFTRGVSR